MELLAAVVLVVLLGCPQTKPPPPVDIEAPSPPSINLKDWRVSWKPNKEKDLHHYEVWWYEVGLGEIKFVEHSVTVDTVDTAFVSSDTSSVLIRNSSVVENNSMFWLFLEDSSSVSLSGNFEWGRVGDSLYYKDRQYKAYIEGVPLRWWIVRTANGDKVGGELLVKSSFPSDSVVVYLVWDTRHGNPDDFWGLSTFSISVDDQEARFLVFGGVLLPAGVEYPVSAMLAMVSAVDSSGNMSERSVDASGTVK